MAESDDRHHLLDGAKLTTDTVVESDGNINTEEATQSVSLPRKELFLIWIIHASQGFQTTMLFPMLVFMVEKYGVPKHATGKYAGFLASLFPFAQFCTSFLWGELSDRTGRKKWLAFGNSIAALSSILLGLCKSYQAACAVRFIGGFFNGSVTITKSILGELCHGSNQAKGFAVLNLAWGIGSITGPVFAGLLAQPCLQYKLSGCPSFLSEYPFLLPCICASLFSAFSVFASSNLKETNPQKNIYQSITSEFKDSETVPLSEKIEGICLLPIIPCEANSIKLSSTCQIHDTLEIEEDVRQKNKFLIRPNGKGEDNGVSIVALKVKDVAKEKAGAPNIDNATKPILQEREVLLSSLCYSMTGLIFIITDELFPLFGAASKTVGGLGLNSSTLGLILGEGGIVLFVYTLLFYPAVAKRFGPLQSFRIGLLTTVPICIMFPGSSLLSSSPILQLAFLLVTMACKSMAGCNVFTGVLILVSNSATQENMGAVTGLSHSFCSLFRAVGPALGGLIWSFSAQQTFHLHQFIAWLAVTFLTFFTFSLSFLLPPSLDRPKVTGQRS